MPYLCFGACGSPVERRDQLCRKCQKAEAVRLERCPTCAQLPKVRRPRGPAPNLGQALRDEVRTLRLLQRRLDDQLWRVTALGVYVEEGYCEKLTSQRLSLTGALERLEGALRKWDAEHEAKTTPEEDTEMSISWLSSKNVADDRKREALARITASLAAAPVLKSV